MGKRRAPSVVMVLKDMLYVSYLLPAERIASMVPRGLVPATADGKNGFLSLVIFKGNTKEAFHIPAPALPFDQVNIRTYVVDPRTKETAVYFIRCGISGRFITFMYRMLSGMPVEPCAFEITADTGDAGDYGSYRVEGNWRGPFTIMASETAPALTGLDPFPNVDGALLYLMNPAVGLYPAWGSLRRLEIFHEPLKPRVCRATGVSFPCLTDLGLLNTEEISEPHNLLLVPYTPFEIFLPPEKEKGPQ
jgi:hypothetical protein